MPDDDLIDVDPNTTSLDDAAKQAFASTVTDVDTDEEEEEEVEATDDTESPEGEAESEGESVEAATPPPTADSFTWDDGVSVTREQARAYVEFEQFLAANPQVAQALQETVRARMAPQDATPSPPQSVTPPENLDLDDPATKVIWDELQATKQSLGAISPQLAEVQAQIARQTEQQNVAIINRAQASFQQTHDLTDDEMTRVRSATERLGVLPQLMAPVDPITGQPRKVDPLAALESAFELAYWQFPDLRDREFASKMEERRKDSKRKAKLTALGGSSGSVPRNAPVPQNDVERKDAMIREIAENWNS